MIRVTVEDTETGEIETRNLVNDYMLLTQGNRYVDGIQHYPTKGTTVLTIKTDHSYGESSDEEFHG